MWIGEQKNRGVGIFTKKGIVLKKKDWKTYCLRCFLPVSINDKFILLAIWACRPYIEEYYLYQQINISQYKNDMVIIGDFNSNKIWDGQHGKRNHSAVVSELETLGLVSAYHCIMKEEQGKETQKTFFLYRNPQKGYHIDYCFADKEKISDFQILSDALWLSLSDHLPIAVDIALPKTCKVME